MTTHCCARCRPIRTRTHRIGAAFTMSAGSANATCSRACSAPAFACRPCHTSCQGYLLTHPDALRTLLAHGMSPNQMNWQHQTLLHHASTADTASAPPSCSTQAPTITARDDDYRSTPLALGGATPTDATDGRVSAVARRPDHTCRTTSRGRRRSPGLPGADMRRSSTSSAPREQRGDRWRRTGYSVTVVRSLALRFQSLVRAFQSLVQSFQQLVQRFQAAGGPGDYCETDLPLISE